MSSVIDRQINEVADKIIKLQSDSLESLRGQVKLLEDIVTTKDEIINIQKQEITMLRDAIHGMGQRIH
jgi:hypothetical protein